MQLLLSCGFCVYIYVKHKNSRYENDDARNQKKEDIWERGEEAVHHIVLA